MEPSAFLKAGGMQLPLHWGWAVHSLLPQSANKPLQISEARMLLLAVSLFTQHWSRFSGWKAGPAGISGQSPAHCTSVRILWLSSSFLSGQMKRSFLPWEPFLEHRPCRRSAFDCSKGERAAGCCNLSSFHLMPSSDEANSAGKNRTHSLCQTWTFLQAALISSQACGQSAAHAYNSNTNVLHVLKIQRFVSPSWWLQEAMARLRSTMTVS